MLSGNKYSKWDECKVQDGKGLVYLLYFYIPRSRIVSDYSSAQ